MLYSCPCTNVQYQTVRLHPDLDRRWVLLTLFDGNHDSRVLGKLSRHESQLGISVAVLHPGLRVLHQVTASLFRTTVQYIHHHYTGIGSCGESLYQGILYRQDM